MIIIITHKILINVRVNVKIMVLAMMVLGAMMLMRSENKVGVIAL